MVLISPALENVNSRSLEERLTLTAILEDQGIDPAPKQQSDIELYNIAHSGSGIEPEGTTHAENGKAGQAKKEKEEQRKRAAENLISNTLANLYRELEIAKAEVKAAKKAVEAAKKEAEAALEEQFEANAVMMETSFDMFEIEAEAEASAEALTEQGYITISDNYGDQSIVFKDTAGQYFTVLNGEKSFITDTNELQIIQKQEIEQGKHCATVDELENNAAIKTHNDLINKLKSSTQNTDQKADEDELKQQKTTQAENNLETAEDNLETAEEKVKNVEGKIENAEAAQKQAKEGQITDINDPAPEGYDKDMEKFSKRKSEIVGIIENNGGKIQPYELENMLKEYSIDPAKLEKIASILENENGFKIEDNNAPQNNLNNTFTSGSPAFNPTMDA